MVPLSRTMMWHSQSPIPPRPPRGWHLGNGLMRRGHGAPDGRMGSVSFLPYRDWSI